MSCVLLFYAYILRGKYSRSPKKVTLRDVALRMFREGLEEVTSHHFAITEVDDAIADLSVAEEEVEDDKTAAMGFALRRRKDTVIYSERAKEFVEAIFDLGIRTGTKVSAEEAENRMWAARSMDGSRAFLSEEPEQSPNKQLLQPNCCQEKDRSSEDDEGTARRKREARWPLEKKR